jgi:uncharacterized protein
MSKKIFVNLSVKDLNKSINFFTKLGFKFDPKFTNKNATCMIIEKEIYVMLLLEKFFKTFTKKGICDSKKNTEMIIALSVESRKKVDDIMKKVIDAKGKETREPMDIGNMYGRSFQDIDGHLWEIFYTDESPANKKKLKI